MTEPTRDLMAWLALEAMVKRLNLITYHMMTRNKSDKMCSVMMMAIVIRKPMMKLINVDEVSQLYLTP